LYLFDFGDVILTGSTTYYLRTKVLAGAEVRTWAGANVYYDELANTLRGDLNGDGIVNFKDLAIMILEWLETESWY
jgi:hypothetical protein